MNDTSWISNPDWHAQLFIALFGVSAVLFSQSNNINLRRWASVLGLVGQPFWFWASWNGEQYGIFALCFLYTMAWGRGFYSCWIDPHRDFTPTNQLSTIRTLLQEDRRWLAADETAVTLIERYQVMASENWYQHSVAHASNMRDDEGKVIPAPSR